MIASINELLGKLPATEIFADVRRRLLNFKAFNERKLLDLNRKKGE